MAYGIKYIVLGICYMVYSSCCMVSKHEDPIETMASGSPSVLGLDLYVYASKIAS